ncbi:MAG: hypothetical protein KDB08_06985 [Microthrixaceae bacterium]|nr:hypothetical protein [Microthrixaceae bacterium]
MNTNSPQAPTPGNPNGVNVTVHVNTTPTPATAPPLSMQVLGYAALGLIVLGFIGGQLVVGGVITFSWP